MKEGDKERFWVVVVLNNIARYKTRIRLFRDFIKQLEHVNHKVVEIAHAERPFEVTDFKNPHHIQLRSKSILWLKENMMNIGISRLPGNWKYVAFVDADVSFSRPDWVSETIAQLQIYKVVQMFSHCIDLGPNEEPLQTHQGFGYSWVHGLYKDSRGRVGPPPTGKYSHWHPGYAWAFTREAIESIGGRLLDFSILGSGDHHMACSFIGQVEKSIPKGISQGYRDLCLEFNERCKALNRAVGYVKMTLLHHWHGKKKDRKYKDRWSILMEHGFDPKRDLEKDWQGVYFLKCLSKVPLQTSIYAYFLERNEDSVDV